MKEDIINKINNLCKAINVSLSRKNLEDIVLHMNMMIKWNEKFNLTSIKDVDEIIIKHYIDSLTVYKYIKDGQSIIDIGTGAGFPGIPLKIANITYDITLLDSVNKKIGFLKSVIKELKLINIKAIHGRAEDFGQNPKYREKFDISVARAVAKLPVLVEYNMPFVKLGGIFIAMKGKNIKELNSSKAVIKRLGGKVEHIEEIILPTSEIKRNIIIIRKIASSPKEFPRKAGKPQREPLL